jgi:outer membrane protein OmpA-like peptidoglycan-associated protein
LTPFFLAAFQLSFNYSIFVESLEPDRKIDAGLQARLLNPGSRDSRIFRQKRIPMKSGLPTTALRRLLFRLLPGLLPFFAIAQQRGDNLVQNPSFETIAAGQTLDLENPVSAAAGWDAPNRGKSMLYTTRGEFIYDPHGALWPFKARTGRNVAGMNVYGEDDGVLRREYIQGTLIRPLTAGRTYIFEFWVHYHCEGANNIGIAFLPDRIRDTAGTGLLRFNPNSYQRKVTPYDNDRNTWALVRDTFVAGRPFQYFVIGNFFHDSLTLIEGNTYNHHFAYIDDIKVYEAPVQSVQAKGLSEKEQKEWDNNAERGKGMAVRETEAGKAVIYFRFDSADITPEAAAQLDDIAARLVSKPNLKMELHGFASSEGGNGYNHHLSKRRNQSVRRYLGKKGIPAARIATNAFGEDQPAADNDTEENRGKNRRVELTWKVE